jgi:DNA-binding CsgD family transcriptional regulator
MKVLTLKEYHQECRKPIPLPKIAKPPKLTAEQKEQIKQLRMEGMKLEWLGMEFGVSHMTIFRLVKNINKVK